jgi:hypothetical protein
MSSKDLWFYFSQVSVCGKSSIAAEEESLNSSIFSIFNKRDHQKSIDILTKNIGALSLILSEVQISDLDATVKQKFKILIDSMIGFNESLIVICSGLLNKVNNLPYSFSQMSNDQRILDAYRQACLEAQNNLLLS